MPRLRARLSDAEISALMSITEPSGNRVSFPSQKALRRPFFFCETGGVRLGEGEVASAPGSPDHVFDTAFSYSNFEHDGLGRYGDPLDPDGDCKAVKEMWSMLRPGGHLILALPVGADCVAFYGNRRYGPLRLGWLLQGFRLRKFYATASPDYHPGPTDPCTAMPQWVFVLERANSVDANPLYSLRAQLPEQFWTLKPLHP